MPIVFIHGVAVRDSRDYRRLQSIRDRYFATLVQNDVQTAPAVQNPYWGGHGAKFCWQLKSLPPAESLDEFGPDETDLRAMLAETADIAAKTKTPLLDLAKRDVRKAIDALWLATAHAADETAGARLASAGAHAMELFKQTESREWLARLTTDEEFVDALVGQLECDGDDTEAFGAGEIYDNLKAGLERFAHSIARIPVEALRPKLNEMLARFVGDAFTYLNDRGERGNEGPIVKVVLAALRKANADRSSGEPLIVIGHSMGGNIAYDVLTHFATDLRCDVLITVGSQVSLFEEMKLFRVSDKSIPSKAVSLVPQAANITRWFNVVDRIDILSYAMSPVFEGASDFEFVSSASPLSAHGSYFYRPTFYHRLRQRLDEVEVT